MRTRYWELFCPILCVRLTATLMLLSMTLQLSAQAPYAAAKFIAEAPDDVYVVQTVATGAQVKKGDILMIFYSPMLKYWKSVLDDQQRQLDINERPFLDGRNSEKLTMLNGRATDLKEVAQEKSDTYLLLKTNSDFNGTVLPVTLAAAKADADAADAAFLEAGIAASQEQRKQADAKDKLSSGKTKLQESLALYQDLNSRLTLRSPMDGKVTTTVMQDCFIRKGHVALTVE